MTSPQNAALGILRPLGGGDPIPLEKDEMIVGRRPTCDVCLDFLNVSSKHCVLRFIGGVWHVRDLGSSNGTTVNGLKLQAEKGVMPDDQIAIATHVFMIDYEPTGPGVNLIDEEDEEIAAKRNRRSLVQLAGLDTDSREHYVVRAERNEEMNRARAKTPARAPEPEGESDAELPALAADGSNGKIEVDDDDFFDMIREDIKK